MRGILALQAQFAQAEHGPLERGTHAKGVCARAVFEVLDVRQVVRDPRLAARLARGLFAQPGTYPATVRFANASGQVRSDAIRDVRALSFAVEVPPGLVSPTVTRLDFSANSAPIFPINDAHAFATLMRVLSAGGALAQAPHAVVAAAAGPARAWQDRLPRRAADEAAGAGLPGAPLLEHGAVPPWRGRSDQVLGHPVTRQPRAAAGARARTACATSSHATCATTRR